MTASVAKSAAPPYAVKVWADERNLYAEIPSINAPYVATFALNEGGLSKALALLGAKHSTEGAGMVYTIPPTNLSKVVDKDGSSEAQRANARDILRRRGIL